MPPLAAGLATILVVAGAWALDRSLALDGLHGAAFRLYGIFGCALVSLCCLATAVVAARKGWGTTLAWTAAGILLPGLGAGAVCLAS